MRDRYAAMAAPLAMPFPGLRKKRRLRRAISLTLAIAVLFGLAACGGDTTPTVSYKPDFLPVKLNIGADGVSISGDKSIVTPIGEFSIGASYSLPKRESASIYVILRDRNRGEKGRGEKGFDDVYLVKSGSDDFIAVVNGKTTIQIRDGQVLIDVTDGTIESVEFKRGEPTTKEGETSWWDETTQRWDNGYHSSWYKPFALCTWAYDDSTISKWWGAGFVWFLIRLILALLLGLVDILLSVVFLLAQVAYMLFGPTGRNIVWGIAILALLFFVVAGFAAS